MPTFLCLNTLNVVSCWHNLGVLALTALFETMIRGYEFLLFRVCAMFTGGFQNSSAHAQQASGRHTRG